MTLASPFVKGGSRGILLSYRLLIFNNNFLIDQISPNPSLLKRGIKRILSQSQRGLPALLPTRGIHVAPLRANPNKTCGASRGKRVQNNVTAHS